MKAAKNSTRQPKYNLANKQKRVENLAAKFKNAMAVGDYQLARQCCQEVNELLPGNLAVMSDYALTLMRTGDYAASYEWYMKIYHSFSPSASQTWLDGLTEVCGWLGKSDEVRSFGHQSLTLADATWRHGASYPYPDSPPPAFEKTKPWQNIISFSLYGGNPRYCETLIKNVTVADELYPGWRCRVFYDQSVPPHVIQRLKDQQVQLVNMSGEQEIPPTLWRFLVLDDQNVARFIVRDADSLISEKEVAAVNEWLTSPFWFHHMRDYFTHTDLLLAGMWGGCNGIFQNIGNDIRNFIREYHGSQRYTDQQYLKKRLWATVRQSIMSHDEIFHFHHAKAYPPHPAMRWDTEAFHIGSNAGYFQVSGKAKMPGSLTQVVDLEFDDQKYSYTCPVKDGEWFMDLPFFMVSLYKNKKLNFHIV